MHCCKACIRGGKKNERRRKGTNGKEGTRWVAAVVVVVAVVVARLAVGRRVGGWVWTRE